MLQAVIFPSPLTRTKRGSHFGAAAASQGSQAATEPGRTIFAPALYCVVCDVYEVGGRNAFSICNPLTFESFIGM